MKKKLGYAEREKKSNQSIREEKKNTKRPMNQLKKGLRLLEPYFSILRRITANWTYYKNFSVLIILFQTEFIHLKSGPCAAARPAQPQGEFYTQGIKLEALYCLETSNEKK